jgi:hypothetical protein
MRQEQQQHSVNQNASVKKAHWLTPTRMWWSSIFLTWLFASLSRIIPPVLFPWHLNIFTWLTGLALLVVLVMPFVGLDLKIKRYRQITRE